MAHVTISVKSLLSLVALGSLVTTGFVNPSSSWATEKPKEQPTEQESISISTSSQQLQNQEQTANGTGIAKSESQATIGDIKPEQNQSIVNKPEQNNEQDQNTHVTTVLKPEQNQINKQTVEKSGNSDVDVHNVIKPEQNQIGIQKSTTSADSNSYSGGNAQTVKPTQTSVTQVDARDQSVSNYKSDARSTAAPTVNIVGTPGATSATLFDDCGKAMFSSTVSPKRNGFSLGGSMFGSAQVGIGANWESDGKQRKGILDQQLIGLNTMVTKVAMMSSSYESARPALRLSLGSVLRSTQVKMSDELIQKEVTDHLALLDSLYLGKPDVWMAQKSGAVAFKREFCSNNTPVIQTVEQTPPTINVPAVMPVYSGPGKY